MAGQRSTRLGKKGILAFVIIGSAVVYTATSIGQDIAALRLAGKDCFAVGRVPPRP